MIWTGKNVLVTGSGGFIGSHLVERLLELGATVQGFIRYNSRNNRGFLPEGASAAIGDLCDLTSVEQAVAGKDVVFHLGALISVPYSFDHSEEVMRTNALGTFNVLESARRHGCQSVVVISSSEVYGSAQYVPIDEKHPKNPQSPYAASKIAADALALSFHAVHQLPVTVVRPFNTFGPRQSDRAIIPTLIVQILHRERLEVGNLDTKRDFTFVLDTVDGMIRAAESPAAIGQEINLGTGAEVTIGELVELLMQKIGRCLPVTVSPERVRSTGSEVRQLLSDNRKAKDLIDWFPKVTFADGLERTIDFVRQHPELYDPQRYRV